MSRPALAQLNPGAAVTVSGSNRTVNIGNPDLDPFEPRAYDLAVEWYFHEEALLSFAYFYKDVDSFIQTCAKTSPSPATRYGLPDAVATAACPGGVNTPGCNPGLLWAFSQPCNTPGGPVEGFEISFQTPFFFLPGFLENFGVIAKLHERSVGHRHYINSHRRRCRHRAARGPVGRNLERDALLRRRSLLGAYIRRLSQRLPDNSPGPERQHVGKHGGDAERGLRRVVSARRALRFTFEGLNLTDEVNDQYLSPDDRMSFYHHYGRQFSAGLRFTY